MDNDNQDDLVNNEIKNEEVDHIKVLRVDNVLNSQVIDIPSDLKQNIISVNNLNNKEEQKESQRQNKKITTEIPN